MEVLCKGFPAEFVAYFQYVRSLRFDDKPDYTYLRKMFRDLFTRETFTWDYLFDWTVLKYQLMNPHITAKVDNAKDEDDTGKGVVDN